MGRLVEGKWTTEQVGTRNKGGHFKRAESGFRNWVTKDGSAGPSGSGGFKAEPNRYHLYISLSCPWAHRTLMFRKLKQLDDVISVSTTDAITSNETGWTFNGNSGHTNDPINNADYMWQVYIAADANYSGRVTVPVLWDKHTSTIVSNESSEIIRMFNSAFDTITGNTVDYYPKALRARIDEINERVYNDINNGVYKCGFATSQKAYDDAVAPLFDALDWVEDILSQNAYLAGDTLTEADWRLFATLIRFDAVYYSHFKCSRRRIADYPHMSRYLKLLYAVPGIADTVDLTHIRTHYFSSLAINPFGIVPTMPELAFLD